MRGRLAEGGPVPGLRGLWGRLWPGLFPLTLDLDAGNGRSERRRFLREGLQPLGSIPAPPLPPSHPQLLIGACCQQVIRRPPRPGIVFRSFLFSTVLSGGLQLPKRFIHPSVCAAPAHTQKLEFPRRLWAEPLSRIHAKAFRPRGDLGKSTCAGLAVCAIVFLPFRRQLLQRRSRLPTWSTRRRPACVGRYSVARKPVSRVRTLCPALVSPAFVQEAP